MSEVTVEYGTAIITITAAVDEATVVGTADATEVSRATDIRYAHSDLHTAYQMACRALGVEPVTVEVR